MKNLLEFIILDRAIFRIQLSGKLDLFPLSTLREGRQSNKFAASPELLWAFLA